MGVIKCDCCGKQILAVVNGNKMVIKNRRHGQTHLVSLSLEDIKGLMNETR